MRSIIQKEKECYFCKTTQGLECHHIFPGTANRKNSEKYGLKVWLCNRHHTGSNESVHHNSDMMQMLKAIGQQSFEKEYGTREDFIRIFGKSVL